MTLSKFRNPALHIITYSEDDEMQDDCRRGKLHKYNNVCEAGEEFLVAQNSQHAVVAEDKSVFSSFRLLLFFFNNLRANLQFTLHDVLSTVIDCFAHIHSAIERTGLTDFQRQNTLLTEHPVLGFI